MFIIVKYQLSSLYTINILHRRRPFIPPSPSTHHASISTLPLLRAQTKHTRNTKKYLANYDAYFYIEMTYRASISISSTARNQRRTPPSYTHLRIISSKHIRLSKMNLVTHLLFLYYSNLFITRSSHYIATIEIYKNKRMINSERRFFVKHRNPRG